MPSRKKFLVSGGITVAGVLSHFLVKGNRLDPAPFNSLLFHTGDRPANGGERLQNEMQMHTAPDSIISLPSKYSATETMNRLEKILMAKGITVFARINQQAEAKKAGLELTPLELLIFGNPKAGTPLMQAEPLAALDLPLKAIAWEGKDGRVWLSYNKPEYIIERYSLHESLLKNISVGPLMEQAVTD
jgi:uncharacterized protein (DUF302 family)